MSEKFEGINLELFSRVKSLEEKVIVLENQLINYTVEGNEEWNDL